MYRKQPQVLALTAVLFLTLSTQTYFASGANILALFTMHGPSHLIVHMSVAKALAEEGHNVTVVSTLKPKVTHESIRHIVIPTTKEHEAALKAQMSTMAKQQSNMFFTFRVLTGRNNSLIRSQFDILQDERYTSLFNTPDTKFDVVLIGYFLNDYLLAAAIKLKCPAIMIWSGPSMELTDAFVGNPREVAYVPNVAAPLNIGERMTFMKRLKNVFGYFFFKAMAFWVHNNMAHYYNELISRDSQMDWPTYEEVRRNVSLVFVNNHFSEGPIRPYIPALVEIGGIQTTEKPDPLPQHIGKFLNSSQEHGAILFSLGSNIQSSTLKPSVAQALFEGFSKLKQNVIWKWEDLNNVPGKSANILYQQWLPQNDILAHPNLKIFITHAGKGGIAEAQYHGVPMLALPIFGDQAGNSAKMAAAGYGLHLNLQELTAQELRDALMELINNPVYRQNVRKFSQLYKDRPLSARESVVYWTEYVIRHHGAAHLQSPLVHLNAIQSSSLDVIAFLVIVLYIIWRVLQLICTVIYKLTFKKLFANKKQKNE